MEMQQNDSLKKIFVCKICKKLLVTPVEEVEEVGNVCGDCLLEIHTKNTLPDRSLDAILEANSLPCRFQSQGCSSKIIYPELKNHESTCHFRLINCVDRNCQWTGAENALSKHFKDAHSEHVLKNSFGAFQFPVNLAETTSVVKLITIGNETFIFALEIDDQNGVMHFLHSLDEGSEKTEWAVKYSNLKTGIKFKCATMPFGTIFDNRSVHKQVIGKLLFGDNIIVTIKPRKFGNKSLATIVLQTLECPICKNLMRKHIILCKTGHSTCYDCSIKLKKCSLCCEPLTGGRNFLAEALTSSLKYQDEEIREFNTHSCPVENCRFKGNCLAVKNHSQTCHQLVFAEGRSFQKEFKSTENNTNCIVYFCQYGLIFQFLCVQIPFKCYCFVKILSPHHTGAEYYYTVSIFDSRKPQDKIIETKPCIYDDSYTNDTNYIWFCYKDLKEYTNSQTGLITFTCTIYNQRCQISRKIVTTYNFT